MSKQSAIQHARMRKISTGDTQYVVHIANDTDGTSDYRYCYYVGDLGDLDRWYHARDHEIVYSTEED